MVHHPAFRVGKKPFAVAGLNRREVGGALSINLGREAQGDLLDDERFMRTPYIGQHGWVTVSHDALRAGELRTLVIESWKRVANRKQLAEYGETANTPAKKKKAAKKKAAKKRATSPSA